MSRNKNVLNTTFSPMAEHQLDVFVEKQELLASKNYADEEAISMLYYATKHDALSMCANEDGAILSGVD